MGDFDVFASCSSSSPQALPVFKKQSKVIMFKKLLKYFIVPVIVIIAGYLLTVNLLEKPDLRIKQYFSVANYLVNDELYFCTYVNAVNRGKQPIGLQGATIDIVLNNRIRKRLTFIPVFPRYYISKEAKAPTIDNPFFYNVTYYENPVKDKEGKSKKYDYHPKEMVNKEVILKPGDYENGYLFFKLEKSPEELKAIHSIKGRVIFETTHGIKATKFSKFKKWSRDKFGERFFIIKEVK